MRGRKSIKLILVIAAILALAFVVIQWNCPKQGLAVLPHRRQFLQLKNRTAIPARQDFDESVTLQAMLEPGDDSARWSQSRAAVVEGYVLEVRKGGIESANCFSVTGRDIHIHIGARPGAPPREMVVVELTPRIKEWAERQDLDWSEAALARELVGRLCRFEGWLMFDIEHADEAENTAPGRAGNWRATGWEIHPVTDIKVLR
ncbi:MAG TPA: hypothetical protein VJQ56_15250 [Blastocatellia bacterium]|nr:hypothetical protein [Blastocatellia bacterium]